jgi:hypothetical protein
MKCVYCALVEVGRGEGLGAREALYVGTHIILLIPHVRRGYE